MEIIQQELTAPRLTLAFASKKWGLLLRSVCKWLISPSSLVSNVLDPVRGRAEYVSLIH